VKKIMSLSALGDLVRQVPQYKSLLSDLSKSRIATRAQVLPNGVPATLATLLDDLQSPLMVVTPRPEDARRLHEQMCLWSRQPDNVLHFPENETLPFERLFSDVSTTHQRLMVLSRLSSYGGGPLMVIASAAAVVQKTLARDEMESATHTLRRGEEIDLDDALELWRRMGYGFEAAVYGPGDASRRGGIIDIYPVGANQPARIELWGSEIDSIRLFDAATQRSDELVDSIEIIPAREILPAFTSREALDEAMAYIDVSNCDMTNRERIREEFTLLLDGHDVEDLNFYAGFFNHGSLLDYFPPGGVLVSYRPNDIAAAAWETEERTQNLRETKEERGELPRNFPSSHLRWSEFEAGTDKFARRVEIAPWGADDLTHQETHVLPFASPSSFLGKIDNFYEEADELISAGHRVVVMTAHSRRLTEIIADYGKGADHPAALTSPPEPGTLTVLQAEEGGIGEGFVLNAQSHKLAVFGDTDVFGVTKQRRVRRRTSAAREAFFAELAVGEYVVHVEHGIARFIGTGRMEGGEDDTEYMILQYAQGDKLYVPMEHLDRVSHYVAPMDSAPNLTRLGTQEWKRTKERVERSTREMAAELLSLYASRELAEGHAFAEDSPWQAELEESFPFEETADQLSTIAEVKSDMENKKPMDRLVCGDVGYGKTEIALRAAFKAVMDNKQVAVLVPTTVLAQQHYVTFSQRLKAFPTRIDVLSRFRSDAEQRDILDKLADGKIDIVIGTHRLIQRDVRFKDLGLVIVDEEQRFGVAHKERLKQMRQEVDVLTLTATPIPRTLHMSLAGVRDMSTIDTPPEERLPVRTYVSEFSDELIREAILRELDRQGQVYFLHNRVHNIEYMANYIQRIVPECEVGIAHGQMHEGELEQAMSDFAVGKMDVLVCTTIIESGLDIPNVNTLIVNRADAFGLAQLYQLRGRVGRSSRRAYAYLLVPRARSMTEAAEKRLKAMMAATELGAGFKIAMKDLEIRGAGNILGAEQSGHIHAVGFDLYTRMLSNAVEELRALRVTGANGTTPESDAVGSPVSRNGQPPDPTIDIGIPASITQEYIPDLPTRLGIYQRLVQAANDEDLERLEDELRDRFGPLPWQVQNLLYTLRLKLRAKKAGIDGIRREQDRIVLHFRGDLGGARQALQRALPRGVEVGGTQVRMPISEMSNWEPALLELIDKLTDFTTRLLAQMAGAR
jgi:transcription-repair coupling factor (superfamily II helicase)